MRIFALSDIHVDYDANAKWVEDLSVFDYQDDVLILAGDLTDKPPMPSASGRRPAVFIGNICWDWS